MAATNSTVGDPEVGSIYGCFFLQIPGGSWRYLPQILATKWWETTGVVELDVFFFSEMFLITLMNGLNGFGNWLMDGCLL